MIQINNKHRILFDKLKSINKNKEYMGYYSDTRENSLMSDLVKIGVVEFVGSYKNVFQNFKIDYYCWNGNEISEQDVVTDKEIKNNHEKVKLIRKKKNEK